MIVHPGLRRAASAIQRLFNGASLYAPLTKSLILERGTGSPTFARADASTCATFSDFEGVLRTVPANCARFTGARLVRNLCPTPSTSIAVSGNKTTTVVPGVFIFSMGIEATGTSLITFTGTATGSTGTLTASASARTSKVLTITVGGTIIATCTNAVAVDIQFEDITGRADQTTPSEYVSVGVLSSPWHGAGIDGAKYFDTTLAGVPIASTTNLGYLAEGSRIQTVPTANQRDMTGWTATTATVLKDQIGMDGAANSASSILATAGNATVKLAVTCAAGWYSVGIKRLVGTGTINITTNNGGAWTDVTSQVNGSTYTVVTGIASALNPTIGIQLVTNTDKVAVDFNQIETAATFAGSSIVGLLTRAADVLTYPLAGNMSNTVGSAYAECSMNTISSAANQMIIGSSGVNRAELYNASGSGNLNAFDGINAPAYIVGAFTAGTIKKVATSYGSSFMRGAASGVVSIDSAFDNNYDYTDIQVGGGNGAANPINGTIRNVRIFQRALSNSELQAITR